MLTLLLKQKLEESKSLKIDLKKEIDCNFIESESEDSEEEDHFESKPNYKEVLNQYEQSTNNIEEKEVKDIHEKLIGPSKFFDEYDIFQKCFKKISNCSKDLVEQWINKLNVREREHLNNMMQIKRIKIIHNNSEKAAITIPRKVVKIKREFPGTVNHENINFNSTCLNDTNI